VFPTNGDIATQSSNLEIFLLRNIVVVIAGVTEWGWCPFAVFDARGACDQVSL